MAYPTQAELGVYVGVSDATSQTQCLNAAIDFVVRHCNRQFVNYTGTYQFAKKNIVKNGRRLMFFRDCISVTTLTNGDGSVITGTYYRKLLNAVFADPVNASFYGVELLPTSSYSFVESTIGYVSVLGSWGYDGANQPPNAIFMAILMIGAQLYRARSGGGGQVTQVQPSGVVLAGVDLDQIVIDMLKPFRRGTV